MVCAFDRAALCKRSQVIRSLGRSISLPRETLVTAGNSRYRWQISLPLATLVTAGKSHYRWQISLPRTTLVTAGNSRYRGQLSLPRTTLVTTGNSRYRGQLSLPQTLFTATALYAGFDTLQTDVDVSFFKDPAPYLRRQSDVDALVTLDREMANSGFDLIAATHNSKLWFRSRRFTFD